LAIFNISYCVQQHKGHKLLRKPGGDTGKGDTGKGDMKEKVKEKIHDVKDGFKCEENEVIIDWDDVTDSPVCGECPTG